MKKLVFLTLICAVGHSALADHNDTDGVELLDLIDVRGFYSNATGTARFITQSIEDLDDANLLTNLHQLLLSNNQITIIELGDFEEGR